MEQGKSVKGVIAGCIIPVRTHWDSKRTVPCLHDITAGKLFCPCTVRPVKNQITFYVPLLTEPGDKLVIPASQLVGQKLMEQNPGSLVELARPKLRCAPLKIILPTPADKAAAWVQRMRQCCTHDIHEYLLHLWQIRTLTEHFGFEFRPSSGTSERMNKGEETAA